MPPDTVLFSAFAVIAFFFLYAKNVVLSVDPSPSSPLGPAGVPPFKCFSFLFDSLDDAVPRSY
jgi:hypothetical protein